MSPPRSAGVSTSQPRSVPSTTATGEAEARRPRPGGRRRSRGRRRRRSPAPAGTTRTLVPSPWRSGTSTTSAGDGRRWRARPAGRARSPWATSTRSMPGGADGLDPVGDGAVEPGPGLAHDRRAARSAANAATSSSSHTTQAGSDVAAGEHAVGEAPGQGVALGAVEAPSRRALAAANALSGTRTAVVTGRRLGVGDAATVPGRADPRRRGRGGVVGDDRRPPRGPQRPHHALGPAGRSRRGDRPATTATSSTCRLRPAPRPARDERHRGGRRRRRRGRDGRAHPRVPLARLQEVAKHIRPWVPVVSLSKGFEVGTPAAHERAVPPGAARATPSPCSPGPTWPRRSSPAHAAAAVVATADEFIASELQALLRHRRCSASTPTPTSAAPRSAGRSRTSIAIAAGMADGLGAGDNTRAAVITRGLAEITRLGVAMGGDPMTFAGLAGMGDLIATCMQPAEPQPLRRRAARRGASRSSEIIAEMHQVAEGVKACRVALELGRRSTASRCPSPTRSSACATRAARRPRTPTAASSARHQPGVTTAYRLPDPCSVGRPSSSTAPARRRRAVVGDARRLRDPSWSAPMGATATPGREWVVRACATAGIAAGRRARPPTSQRLVDGLPVVETSLRVPAGQVVQRVWCVADAAAPSSPSSRSRTGRRRPSSVALGRRRPRRRGSVAGSPPSVATCPPRCRRRSPIDRRRRPRVAVGAHGVAAGRRVGPRRRLGRVDPDALARRRGRRPRRAGGPTSTPARASRGPIPASQAASITARASLLVRGARWRAPAEAAGSPRRSGPGATTTPPRRRSSVLLDTQRVDGSFDRDEPVATATAIAAWATARAVHRRRLAAAGTPRRAHRQGGPPAGQAAVAGAHRRPGSPSPSTTRHRSSTGPTSPTAADLCRSRAGRRAPPPAVVLADLQALAPTAGGVDLGRATAFLDAAHRFLVDDTAPGTVHVSAGVARRVARRRPRGAPAADPGGLAVLRRAMARDPTGAAVGARRRRRRSC